MTRPLAERLAEIEVLVLDVDGVLTDGRIIYSDAGAEIHAFHVRDGSGIALWRRAGHRVGCVTGRGSKALERRAAELGIDPVLQQVPDKAGAFAALVAQMNVTGAQVAVVGDDLPDLPMLRRAGVAIAVADACPEVQAIADLITEAPGGRGAVREAIERILQAQGRWRDLIAAFDD